VRRWFADQATGEPCARARRATRVLAQLPRRLRDVAAARGTPGNPGRTATATVASLTDLYREYAELVFVLDRPRGGGLRGGRWLQRGDTLRLVRFSLVPGVTVSGTLRRVDRPTGRLTVGGSAASRGTLTLARNGILSGRLGGRAVRVRFRVPRPADGEGESPPPAAATR
jgi:hypothetical protein